MSTVPSTARIAAGLGLLGSLLVALAAPAALGDPVVHWWYDPHLLGRSTDLVLVWLGMAVMAAAWLALGRALPRGRWLGAVALAWALPLALAPPLFSRDVYSYLAQGTIMHLGHSPYTTSPRALAGLGQAHVLAAVSPFWRGTTAPYGPLFLGLVSLIVGVAGGHLVAGVLLVRLLGLLGLAALGLAVPRLTRATGGDARRALWLLLLSPLTMLELIAAGHNDLLMAGLLAVGLAVALSGRPLLAIGICAIAAAIKIPALAACAFICVAWVRAEPGRAGRLRFAVSAAAITVAVLVVLSLLTGSGAGWLSSSVFATPARVRLAITPATAIGDTIGQLLRALGVATTGRGLEAAIGLAASAATVAAGIVLLRRVRVSSLVASLGGFLAIAAAAGPAAWPWYFIWALVCGAVLPGPARRRALPAAIAVSAFLVKPDGILALPLGSSPIVLVLLLAAAAVTATRRRERARHTVRPGAGAGAGAPALAEPRDAALTGS